MRRVHGERGDIIVGWLTKIVVVLALVGVVGFDLVSVGAAKVSAADTASRAARAGADVWADTKGDVQAAYLAALRHAEEHGGAIDPADFTVATDGTVTVKVTRTATTLLLYRHGTTKKWAHVVAEGSGRAP